MKNKFCGRCGEYTQHIYVASARNAEDEVFDRLATVANLSAEIALLNDSPTYFQCSKCGFIKK